jgi:hypothetical protein
MRRATDHADELTTRIAKTSPTTPADHFWPLQWAEAGIFIAIAVLLAGFCFWWTRRRLT